MYCAKCGNRTVDGAIFCNRCGASLKTNDESEKDAKGNKSDLEDSKETNPFSDNNSYEINKSDVRLSSWIYVIGTLVILIQVLFFTTIALIRADIIRNPFSNKEEEMSMLLANIRDSESEENVSETNETEEQTEKSTEHIISQDEELYAEPYSLAEENDSHEVSEEENLFVQDSLANRFSEVDYILPDSDSRYYDIEEIDSLSLDELRIARNEIYARHGRKFSSEDLREYFESKNWYEPKYDEISDNELNDYEKTNRDMIKDVEQLMEEL